MDTTKLDRQVVGFEVESGAVTLTDSTDVVAVVAVAIAHTPLNAPNDTPDVEQFVIATATIPDIIDLLTRAAEGSQADVLRLFQHPNEG